MKTDQRLHYLPPALTGHPYVESAISHELPKGFANITAEGLSLLALTAQGMTSVEVADLPGYPSASGVKRRLELMRPRVGAITTPQLVYLALHGGALGIDDTALEIGETQQLPLTRRHHQVMGLGALGLSLDQTAKVLSEEKQRRLSPRTMEITRSEALKRLGTSSMCAGIAHLFGANIWQPHR